MNEGKNLWNAVDLVARAGKEISALVAELNDKMADQLKITGGALNFISVAGDDDEDESEDGWVCTAWLTQWGLKPKGKGQKVRGNLYVQIILWTEDEESVNCEKIPRIEVGYIGCAEDKIVASYSEAGSSFTQEFWKNMFPKADKSSPCWPKSVKTDKGVRWDEEANWVFSIPLFSVNSNDDIDRIIIEPAMKLLSGSTPEIAFKDVVTIGFAIGKEGELLSLPA